MKKNRFIRRVNIICFLFFLNVSLIFISSATASPAAPAPDPTITHTLPEKTDLFFQCTSLETLYDNLSITPDTFWGEPIDGLEEIESELGLNPFDLAALRTNGFDVARPMGVGILDFKIVDEEDPHLNLLLFLPAKDEQKAMAWIKSAIEKQNGSTQFQKKGDIWQWQFNEAGIPSISSDVSDAADGIENKDATHEASMATDQGDGNLNGLETETSMPSFSFPNYMTAANGYLMLGTNPSEDMGTLFGQLAQQLKKKGTSSSPRLAKSAKFKKVLGKLTNRKDLILYADIERLISENPESMAFLSHFSPGYAMMGGDGAADDASTQATLAMLKEYKAFGGAVDLENPNFTADFYLDLVKDSKLFTLFKGVPVNRNIILGFQENPVMLWGFTQNMQSYWQLIRETLDQKMVKEMESEFAKVKTDYGIDVETDIIANLGNNFGVGIYDGMSINMGNINALLSLEFKDAAKIHSVIETAIKALPEEQQMMVNRIKIGGKTVYMMPVGPFQVYAGFKENRFMITMGKPMFEKALASDVSKGFLTTITDKGLKSTLRADHSMTYLNMMELYYIVKNFLPMVMSVSPDAAMAMTPEFQKIVALFDHIRMGFTAEKEGFKGNFVIKTHFDGPFLKGVRGISDQIMEMKQKGAM